MSRAAGDREGPGGGVGTDVRVGGNAEAIRSDDILTPTGKKYLALAETRCILEFETDLKGVNLGDYLTKPLAKLPGWRTTINAYMRMPGRGFDKPSSAGSLTGRDDAEVDLLPRPGRRDPRIIDAG